MFSKFPYSQFNIHYSWKYKYYRREKCVIKSFKECAAGNFFDMAPTVGEHYYFKINKKWWYVSVLFCKILRTRNSLLRANSKSLISKRDRERFTQVALYKRANRSHGSLKSPMWVICSWFENIAKKIVSFVCFDSFSLFMLLSPFAHLHFFKEQLERFAPVPLYKRATVSDSFRSNSQPWTF